MDLEPRVLPQSIDIEESVIAVCITQNEHIVTVLEKLNKDCFYKPLHQLIFAAIQCLFNKKVNVDIISITQELKRLNQLDAIGGVSIISELAGKAQWSTSIEYHVHILLQQYLRRDIIEKSNQAIEKAYNDTKDPLETMDEYVKDAKGLYDHITFGVVESTEHVFNNVMKRLKAKAPVGRSTGFKALDQAIIAFEPGKKYTIAGRPSMGKSALGKTLMINLINQGSPGIFFSLEMEAEQVMDNIISAICQVNSKHLRRPGYMSEEQQASIARKMKAFNMTKLIIDDKSDSTPSYIHKKTKKAIKDHGIEWIMLDYTQMAKVDHPKGKMWSQQVGEFSQELKNLAKSEHIFVIEIAQINRASEKEATKKPMLSDIKDSSVIEASADTVFLLYRAEYYGFQTTKVNGNEVNSKGIAEIIIAKQRSGEVGSVFLDFIPQYTAFEDRATLPYAPTRTDESIPF